MVLGALGLASLAYVVMLGQTPPQERRGWVVPKEHYLKVAFDLYTYEWIYTHMCTGQYTGIHTHVVTVLSP